MKRLLGFALVAALAIGCGKKDEDKPADQPPPTEQPPTEQPPTDTPPDTPADDTTAAADEELPTAEDFEDEASKDITETNLEKELADLEKEIGE